MGYVFVVVQVIYIDVVFDGDWNGNGILYGGYTIGYLLWLGH